MIDNKHFGPAEKPELAKAKNGHNREPDYVETSRHIDGTGIFASRNTRIPNFSGHESGWWPILELCHQHWNFTTL